MLLKLCETILDNNTNKDYIYVYMFFIFDDL